MAEQARGATEKYVLVIVTVTRIARWSRCPVAIGRTGKYRATISLSLAVPPLTSRNTAHD